MTSSVPTFTGRSGWAPPTSWNGSWAGAVKVYRDPAVLLGDIHASPIGLLGAARADGVPKIAVVAHTGKSLGGGLGELREVLAREGVAAPLWYEVRKSRKAPKRARKALAHWNC